MRRSLGDTRKPSVVSAFDPTFQIMRSSTVAGPRMRRAIALAIALLVSACAHDATTVKPSSEHADDADPATVPLTGLELATFDGSNQTVHPDHVAMPPTWPAAKQYLVATPYPRGDLYFENPSLYARTATLRWEPPAGMRNPLVTPAVGYLSDPDALYNPESKELWVYYRQASTVNQIRLIRSTDGVHFTDPVTVVQGPNHTIVSPSVVRRGPGDWIMWAVNANVGCDATRTAVEVRHSADGLAWSEPDTVQLVQPKFFVWHIDVQWIPSRGEFWAMYNVKTAGSCATPALFLATSPDGKTWTTYPSPVLARGTFAKFADIVYRSTFAYDSAADAVRIWYSGARYDQSEYVWSSGFQRLKRTDLWSAINRAPSAALMSAIVSRSAPPLRVVP